MNKKKENTKLIEQLLRDNRISPNEYPRGLASELAKEFNLSRSRISKIALNIDIQSTKQKIKEEAH